MPQPDIYLRNKIDLANDLGMSDRALLCLVLVRLDDIEARMFSPSLHAGASS